MSCNSMGICGNRCNYSLRHVEQIALNKGSMDCLIGRVCRNEADIRDRYTKAELDRMLEGKLDKCAFEKHLVQCGDTGSCDCGDISHPWDCDCYTKDEVSTLLEGKSDRTVPEQYDLPILDGFKALTTMKNCYSKSQQGLVLIEFCVARDDDSDFDQGIVAFAALPPGFQPAGQRSCCAAIVSLGDNLTSSQSVQVYIAHSDESAAGELRVQVPISGVKSIRGQLVFYTTQC